MGLLFKKKMYANHYPLLFDKIKHSVDWYGPYDPIYNQFIDEMISQASCSPRDIDIFRMYYGFKPYNYEHDMRFVMDEFYLSSTRIYDILNNVYRKLTHPTKLRILRDGIDSVKNNVKPLPSVYELRQRIQLANGDKSIIQDSLSQLNIVELKLETASRMRLFRSGHRSVFSVIQAIKGGSLVRFKGIGPKINDEIMSQLNRYLAGLNLTLEYCLSI